MVPQIQEETAEDALYSFLQEMTAEVMFLILHHFRKLFQLAQQLTGIKEKPPEQVNNTGGAETTEAMQTVI